METKEQGRIRQLKRDFAEKWSRKTFPPLADGIRFPDAENIIADLDILIEEIIPSSDDGRNHIPHPDKPTEFKHYQNIGFIRGWRAAINEILDRVIGAEDE